MDWNFSSFALAQPLTNVQPSIYYLYDMLSTPKKKKYIYKFH